MSYHPYYAYGVPDARGHPAPAPYYSVVAWGYQLYSNAPMAPPVHSYAHEGGSSHGAGHPVPIQAATSYPSSNALAQARSADAGGPHLVQTPGRRTSSRHPPPVPDRAATLALYNLPGFPPYCPWEMPSNAAVPPRPVGRGPWTPPINRLPPELLAPIFLDVMPTQLLDATCSRSCAPLMLSHVCGYWRQVAIDTPGLWQWISLTECRTRRQHRSRKLARRFVKRTKGLGLSIYFRDVEATSVDEDRYGLLAYTGTVQTIPAHERCHCALNMIIHHIASVRVLEMFIGQASAQRLSAIPAFAATSLRNLRINFVEGGEAIQSLSKLVSTSPQLYRLLWSSRYRMCAVPSPTGVDWGQLTIVFMDESPIPPSAFLDMLSIGRSLKQVWVRITPSPSSPVDRYDKVVQHKLEQLYICGNEALDDVLNHLRLPSLQKLTLREYSEALADWPCADSRAIHRFVAGTSALSELRLSSGGTFDEDAFISLLSLPQTSQLTELHAFLRLFSDKFFLAMDPTDHRGVGPILPRVVRISLRKCNTTDGTASHMLWARKHGNYPLVNAQIFFHRREHKRHPVDKQEFLRLGMVGVLAEDIY